MARVLPCVLSSLVAVAFGFQQRPPRLVSDSHVSASFLEDERATRVFVGEHRQVPAAAPGAPAPGAPEPATPATTAAPAPPADPAAPATTAAPANATNATNVTTTRSPFAPGATAAEMSGVQANGAGDLPLFITGLVTNTILLTIFILVFSHLRLKFPIVYASNGIAAARMDSFFGWIGASLSLTMDEIIDHCGLDQAMMIEFTHFSMRLLAIISVPMLCIMGPVHWLQGGDAADDKLSNLGMANVEVNHPWIYWVHGALVWLVVVLVQSFMYTAQRRFLERRVNWLKSMPPPRATTLLVQGIPEEHCTDDRVKKYFDRVFDKKVVDKVHLVKHTGPLLELIREQEEIDHQLHEALFAEKTTGVGPQIADKAQGGIMVEATNYYKEQSKAMAKLVKDERKRMQDAAYKEDLTICTPNAFVTFKTRRDAEVALFMTYTVDDTEFDCEIAPDPADVIYEDLQKDPVKERLMSIVGYMLIAGVYWAYMPAVIGIAYITDLETLAKGFPCFQGIAANPSTVDMWNAMMGSLALQLFVSFVPTFFMLIFSFFFVLKAHAWLQHRIQVWYFWFQVVYILLVTAVGTSLISTLDDIVEAPFTIFYLLATTMPYATHFYLNFIPLQWVTHAQNLLRMANLFKFFFYSMRADEAVAKKKSEPEDQDYYGIGSRTARHAFILALVLVYCSLTPLILPLGIVNFFMCRLAYGYLVYFAESRKPDLGGAFWVSCLVNVQRCMLIYIFLMTGVLCYRDYHVGPCLIAASSVVYWAHSYYHFAGSFRWETLCLEDLINDKSGHFIDHKPTCVSYEQRELTD